MDRIGSDDELRARIEQLKLELVSFVLFEVQKDGLAGAGAELAGPLRAAVEKSVREVVEGAFDEGKGRIDERAAALESKSQAVEEQIGKAEQKLLALSNSLTDAADRAKRHSEQLQAMEDSAGVLAGTLSGYAGSVAQVRKRRAGIIPPDTKSEEPESPEDGDEAERPRTRPWHAKLFRWVKEFWLELVVVGLLMVVVLAVWLGSTRGDNKASSPPSPPPPQQEKTQPVSLDARTFDTLERLSQAAVTLRDIARGDANIAITPANRERLDAALTSAATSTNQLRGALASGSAANAGPSDPEFALALRQTGVEIEGVQRALSRLPRDGGQIQGRGLMALADQLDSLVRQVTGTE